jgi:predicted transcriptional regulator
MGEGYPSALARSIWVSLLIEDRKLPSNGHRGRLDIIADILEASAGTTRKTYLMYRCNLAFRQLKYYLEFLVKKGLITIITDDGDPNPDFFKITEKGKEFLKAYKGLKALMN